MTVDRGAAALLRSVGLLADGPAVWGRPVPASGPGVFIVEWPSPPSAAPIELTAVGAWIARIESLSLDGVRPTSRQVAARIASFWLPSTPVLYIGASRSVARRATALWTTLLGDRRPHAGGHWLRTLRGLEAARIWWASTDALEEYEDALLTAFAETIDPAERAGLPDPDTVLPFANLRTVTGERRRTGLTGSLVVEPKAEPSPPTRIVRVPDGAADGADGGPPIPRGRSRPAGARPATARAVAAASRPTAAPVHLTVEGAARMRRELDELTTARRPEVISRIRAAKELGDLKENADYTAAREEQSFLEGRIQSLEAQLRDAEIIDVPAPGSRIGLGSTVTIEVAGQTMTYAIVGSAESDPAAGRISGGSPVGKALIGRLIGDQVDVQTPNGVIGYRIVAVD
jgi:transcription elongation factor GreA